MPQKDKPMDDPNNGGLYNTEDLRAFLLGRLPEADAAPIEERMIADEAFFREIQNMEDEIIDEYAMGNLSLAEVRNFLERSEGQPELSRRIAMRKTFFAALKTKSTQASRQAAGRSSKASTALPLLCGRVLIPGLAIAASMLLAACVFLLHAKRGLEIHLAEAERAQELSGSLAMHESRNFQTAASASSHMARMFFATHIARGASGQAPLQLSAAQSGPVEFQLETPVGASSTRPWSVSISDEHGTLILQTGLRVQQIDSVSFVHAYVDPSTFGPGNYNVLLSSAVEPKSGYSMRWRLMITK
jgi:hypothetical protein